MGLGLYSKPDSDYPINSLNPFTVTFDGRIGGAQDRLIYLRNDDTDRWFNNITVQAIDPSGDDWVDGTIPGFSWRLMQQDVAPTEEEWGLVAAGNTLSISTVLGSSIFADIVTYVPIWVRVQIPRGQAVSTITEIIFRISATENAI